jgi:glutamate synthase (ferredoxin)
VLIAALIGADEFSFGTLAMIAEGCILARVCHNNTCPVGVATQDPKLRAKFTGKVEHVVALFTFIAQEVRELLAQLGFRSLDEVIGHTELLEQRMTGDPVLDSLDLSPILAQPDVPSAYRFLARPDYSEPQALGNRLAAEVLAALKAGERRVVRSYPIRNTDRTVGAALSGELVRAGLSELPPHTVDITFHGSAGQSFGAFLPPGVTFRLFGDANDYVGKGLAGGILIIRPPDDAGFVWSENYIIGNTVLYGATGGVLYAAGRAGERFAVRNSRGNAVVEGVGDHGCEYMTGGTVVVLGRTGINFGAGMTGGQAFVLDTGTVAEPEFPARVNHELVFLTRVEDPEARSLLYRMVSEHLAATDSPLAADLLARWDEVLPRFWHVRPRWMIEGIRAVGEEAAVVER